MSNCPNCATYHRCYSKYRGVHYKKKRRYLINYDNNISKLLDSPYVACDDYKYPDVHTKSFNENLKRRWVNVVGKFEDNFFNIDDLIIEEFTFL